MLTCFEVNTRTEERKSGAKQPSQLAAQLLLLESGSSWRQSFVYICSFIIMKLLFLLKNIPPSESPKKCIVVTPPFSILSSLSQSWWSHFRLKLTVYISLSLNCNKDSWREMKDIDFHSTPHFLSLDPRDKKIVVFAVNIENYATSQKWL